MHAANARGFAELQNLTRDESETKRHHDSIGKNTLFRPCLNDRIDTLRQARQATDLTMNLKRRQDHPPAHDPRIGHIRPTMRGIDSRRAKSILRQDPALSKSTPCA
jgi:hypothetical protein